MTDIATWQQTVQREVSAEINTPAIQNFSRLQAFGSIEYKPNAEGTSVLYRWKNPAEWDDTQPNFGATRVAQVVSGIDLRIIAKWYRQKPIEIFETVENLNLTDYAGAFAKYSNWVMQGRWKWWDKHILNAVGGVVYTEENGVPGTKVFPNDDKHTIVANSAFNRGLVDSMMQKLYENLQNSGLDDFARRPVLIIRASDWRALRSLDRGAQFASNETIAAFDKTPFKVGSSAPYFMFEDDGYNSMIIPVPDSWIPDSVNGKHYVYAYNPNYLPRTPFKISAKDTFLVHQDDTREGSPIVISAGMLIGATRAYDDAFVRAEVTNFS